MKKYITVLAAIAVVSLQGCSTTPATSGQALAACQGLTATVNAMASIKPQLSPDAQQKVGTALNAAAAFCLMPNPPTNANMAVAGILSSLNALALQMSQQGAVK